MHTISSSRTHRNHPHQVTSSENLPAGRAKCRRSTITYINIYIFRTLLEREARAKLQQTRQSTVNSTINSVKIGWPNPRMTSLVTHQEALTLPHWESSPVAPTAHLLASRKQPDTRKFLLVFFFAVFLLLNPKISSPPSASSFFVIFLLAWYDIDRYWCDTNSTFTIYAHVIHSTVAYSRKCRACAIRTILHHQHPISIRQQVSYPAVFEGAFFRDARELTISTEKGLLYLGLCLAQRNDHYCFKKVTSNDCNTVMILKKKNNDFDKYWTTAPSDQLAFLGEKHKQAKMPERETPSTSTLQSKLSSSVNPSYLQVVGRKIKINTALSITSLMHLYALHTCSRLTSYLSKVLNQLQLSLV